MPLTTPPESIASAQLLLRRLARTDLADLLEVNGDPEVTRCLPYAAWKSMADAEAWYLRMENLQKDGNAIQWVIARREDQRVVGTCLLFRYEQVSECAEIGYVMGRPYWGRGWMREALVAMIDWIYGSTPMRRLEGHVDGRNPASAALLSRLGFTLEGVLRERWRVGSELTDCQIYGLLRRDWQQR